MTTTKYIVHYKSYGYSPKGGRIGSTKTFRRIESAKSDLDAFRDGYRKAFERNGYRYHDGSGPITPEELEKNIETFFYIEKQVIESERLDY